MKNLEKVSAVISKALKHEGMFISLVYLESEMFFESRKAMMDREHWKDRFTNTILSPFIFETSTYLNIFGKIFKTGYEETYQMDSEVSLDDLIGMFKSYFPEVRQLVRNETNQEKKDEISSAFLKEFVESLTEECKIIRWTSKESLIFTPYVHYYQGFKKNQEGKSKPVDTWSKTHNYV